MRQSRPSLLVISILLLGLLQVGTLSHLANPFQQNELRILSRNTIHTVMVIGQGLARAIPPLVH